MSLDEALDKLQRRRREARARGAVFAYREPHGVTRGDRVLHVIGCNCVFDSFSRSGDVAWPTIPDEFYVAVPRDQAERLVRRRLARWSRTCCVSVVLG